VSYTGQQVVDWVARVFVPAWLDTAGRGMEAETLRNAVPITDIESARAVAVIARVIAQKWPPNGEREETDAASAALQKSGWLTAWKIGWDEAPDLMNAADWISLGSAAQSAAESSWNHDDKNFEPTVDALTRSLSDLQDTPLSTTSPREWRRDHDSDY
jgi:hypothetical protein